MFTGGALPWAYSVEILCLFKATLGRRADGRGGETVAIASRCFRLEDDAARNSLYAQMAFSADGDLSG